MDTSGVDNFDDDARKKLLHDMLNLYLWVRSYLSVGDIVSKHKLFFEEKTLKGSSKKIKKWTEKPQINE